MSFLYKPWLFAINQSFCVLHLFFPSLFIFVTTLYVPLRIPIFGKVAYNTTAFLNLQYGYFNSHIDPRAAFFLRKKNIRRRTSLFFSKSSLRLVICRICYFLHRMYAVKSVETIPSSDQNYRHISVLINPCADIAFRVCSDKSLIKDSKEVSRWKL